MISHHVQVEFKHLFMDFYKDVGWELDVVPIYEALGLIFEGQSEFYLTGQQLQLNEDGTLTYSFVESVKATWPFYVIRLSGGLLYLGGMLVMSWNVIKTVQAGRAQAVRIPAPAMAHA